MAVVDKLVFCGFKWIRQTENRITFVIIIIIIVSGSSARLT